MLQPTPDDAAIEWARIACVLLGEATFAEFCEWFVQIEDPHRGPIPFELWPHLLTRAEAWQAGGDECILKARQLGISWLAAAYSAWNIMSRPSSKVLVISKGEDDAKLVVDHARFILDHLPWHPKLITDNVTTLEVAGGGTMMAKAATKDAGRGATASLVIIDEAAFHPYAAENFKAYRPTMADGGQLIILSTANGAGGWFHDRYWQADAGRAEGMRAVFIPWHARPGRDAAWLARERSQYEGNPAEFRQEYPADPSEAFVAHTGLVYGLEADTGVPIFSRERNVKPPPWRIDDSRFILSAVDPGGSDPTAAIVAGVSHDDRIHVYGLYYRRGSEGASVLRVADYLSRYPKIHRIWPDGTGWVGTLRSMGYDAHPPHKDRDEGIGAVTEMLLAGTLTFSPELEALFKEFGTYWWAERKDMAAGGNRTETRAPSWHHADALDAVRMLVLGYRKMMPRGKKPSPV